jgi:hypothetical protein
LISAAVDITAARIGPQLVHEPPSNAAHFPYSSAPCRPRAERVKGTSAQVGVVRPRSTREDAVYVKTAATLDGHSTALIITF